MFLISYNFEWIWKKKKMEKYSKIYDDKNRLQIGVFEKCLA